jgi:hypothetical protein
MQIQRYYGSIYSSMTRIHVSLLVHSSTHVGLTRELGMRCDARILAMQIQREFVRIERTVTAVCIYGGAPSGPQERALQDGVDVVVGTPGTKFACFTGALLVTGTRVHWCFTGTRVYSIVYSDALMRW